MLELLVHIPVLILVVIDLWMHYQHHKRRKADLETEKLYTLDEAKVALFETVALADPEVFALPRGFVCKKQD